MRIARDMHDGLLREISRLTLQLAAALPHVRTAPDATAERLAGMLGDAQLANHVALDAGVTIVISATRLRGRCAFRAADRFTTGSGCRGFESRRPDWTG